MSRTILAEVEGFTPLIDAVTKDLGLTASAVFGRAWRFCQMKDGVCKASLEKIADGLEIDRATVLRHLDRLCAAGYLQDLTPELRNRPHTYADTGKAGLYVGVSTVAPCNTEPETVAQRNTTLQIATPTVAKSDLKKDSKTEIEETIAEGRKTVDFILESALKKSYLNRDKIPEPYLEYADCYNRLTGQEPTKRVLNDWLLAFAEWQSEGIAVRHLELAYEYANRPEGGFLVARPGSLTNTAVAMKSRGRAPVEAEPFDPFASLKRMVAESEVR